VTSSRDLPSSSPSTPSFWKAEIPLGPDNKYKKLNDEWSAYYDDEAGAVYYYNEISGEATWIKPKIEKQKSISAANYI
jgi:hypothetical protein